MKKINFARVNLMIRITFLSLFLITFSTCSLLDSLDSKGHVRFKNSTAETFAGVRVDGGAEYNKTFAPSATTDYMDNEPGNFGVDVKVGETWTFVSVLDGGTLGISTGNDYTITIGRSGDLYTASQVKD